MDPKQKGGQVKGVVTTEGILSVSVLESVFALSLRERLFERFGGKSGDWMLVIGRLRKSRWPVDSQALHLLKKEHTHATQQPSSFLSPVPMVRQTF
jgi:hypothetical protein